MTSARKRQWSGFTASVCVVAICALITTSDMSWKGIVATFLLIVGVRIFAALEQKYEDDERYAAVRDYFEAGRVCGMRNPNTASTPIRWRCLICPASRSQLPPRRLSFVTSLASNCYLRIGWMSWVSRDGE